MRRTLWGLGIVGFWLLALVGAVLAAAGAWIRHVFGPVSVDQLLVHLFGAEGALGGEGAGGSGIVAGAVGAIVVLPVAAVLAVALLAEKSRRELRAHGVLDGRGGVWFRVLAGALAVLLPLGGAALLGSVIGAGDYARAAVLEAASGKGLADYFVAPVVGGGDPAPAPRNLVLVYLESVEQTYADERIFGESLLAPLEEATAGWASIDGLEQVAGGGWTMSGVVGTQCGVPLRSAGALTGPQELNAIGADGHEVAAYLPGATCLGDVLAAQGYRNVYLGGASAAFAGKGAFLRTHGYDEVDDLGVWLQRGETERRSDWGLSDRRLFELGAERAIELHEAGEPFNLTMLSLDTHESPYAYAYCPDARAELARGDDSAAMAAITRCSMEQVAGFVDALEAAGVLEDTAVVVMGDHLKMLSSAYTLEEELSGVPHRTIFNRIWSPDGRVPARGGVDQLSLYPTLLELVGLEVRDHRAGVGVSALVPAAEAGPGTMLDLDARTYEAVVRSRSAEFYRELWRAP